MIRTYQCNIALSTFYVGMKCLVFERFSVCIHLKIVGDFMTLRQKAKFKILVIFLFPRKLRGVKKYFWEQTNFLFSRQMFSPMLRVHLLGVFRCSTRWAQRTFLGSRRSMGSRKRREPRKYFGFSARELIRTLIYDHLDVTSVVVVDRTFNVRHLRKKIFGVFSGVPVADRGLGKFKVGWNYCQIFVTTMLVRTNGISSDYANGLLCIDPIVQHGATKFQVQVTQ